MKKQVSGVAGAARIKNIDRAGLARAEKHGKRLDKTGKARAINDLPSVTTTGLHLQTLYEKHIEGAFVPKAKSSAMHLLIQFPTELVDGDDAEYMLHHARAFAERVFGEQAIFADRVDRDERSQRVVDLFLAPRYTKTTIRESKPAVSTTHHLKALAKRHGEKPIPFGYGRALQTAFFEYMRDVMQLAGVERGKAKAVPGQDWKSAEQQRTEELDDLHAQANAKLERIEREQAAAQADRIAAAAMRAAAKADGKSLTDDRRALDLNREDIARRAAELARREREMKEAQDALCSARVAVERQQAELAAASATAARASDLARDNAIAAAKARSAAQSDSQVATRLLQQALADRAAIDDERAHREAELALLMKASNDINGLDLRSAGSSITMNERAMNEAERVTYRRPWPAPVRVLAVTLANALEQARILTRRLLDREARVAAREAALTAKERTSAHEFEQRRIAQTVEHERVLATLTIRETEVNVAASAAARITAEAAARLAVASEAQRNAAATAATQENWAKAIEIVARHPAILIHDDNDGFRLDHRRERTGPLPDWFVSTLQQPAPLWARSAITGLHRLELMIEAVEAREREADHYSEQLQDMINVAGPSLRADQKTVVEQATRTIRQARTALHKGDQDRTM